MKVNCCLCYFHIEYEHRLWSCGHSRGQLTYEQQTSGESGSDSYTAEITFISQHIEAEAVTRVEAMCFVYNPDFLKGRSVMQQQTAW